MRLRDGQLESALLEHERLAITGAIWTDVRKVIAQAPEICFVKDPSAYPVVYWIWQLYKKRIVSSKDDIGIIYVTNDSAHLAVALLTLGLLGGVPCSCNECRGRSFEDSQGRFGFSGSEPRATR